MAEKYYTSISGEPSTGSVRGKVPGTLVRDMDADVGDVIEWTLKSDGTVKGRLMSSKEAAAYKEASGRGPKAKAKKATKTTAKAKKSKKAGSKKKGRKTEVEYDKPSKKKVKKVLKPLKKKGKKGKK